MAERKSILDQLPSAPNEWSDPAHEVCIWVDECSRMQLEIGAISYSDVHDFESLFEVAWYAATEILRMWARAAFRPQHGAACDAQAAQRLGHIHLAFPSGYMKAVR